MTLNVMLCVTHSGEPVLSAASGKYIIYITRQTEAAQMVCISEHPFKATCKQLHSQNMSSPSPPESLYFKTLSRNCFLSEVRLTVLLSSCEEMMQNNQQGSVYISLQCRCKIAGPF